MIEIKGTTIRMTRGDTLQTIVVPRDKVTHEIYTPQEGDSFRFALKHNKMNSDRSEYTDSEPLVLKDIPSDSMLLTLLPEDTKELGFGQYVYDIQLTDADGRVDTFISMASLILTGEVE